MFYPIDFFSSDKKLADYIELLEALKVNGLAYQPTSKAKKLIKFLLEETTGALETEIESLKEQTKLVQQNKLNVTELVEQLKGLQEQLLKPCLEQASRLHKNFLFLVNYELQQLQEVTLPFFGEELRDKNVLSKIKDAIAELVEFKNDALQLIEADRLKKDFDYYRYQITARQRIIAIGLETRGAFIDEVERVSLKQEQIALTQELKQREIHAEIDRIQHEISCCKMKIVVAETHMTCSKTNIFETKRQEEILRYLFNKTIKPKPSIYTLTLASMQEFDNLTWMVEAIAPSIINIIDGEQIIIYGLDPYGNHVFTALTKEEFTKGFTTIDFPDIEKGVKVFNPSLMERLQSQRLNAKELSFNAEDLSEITADITAAKEALTESDSVCSDIEQALQEEKHDEVSQTSLDGVSTYVELGQLPIDVKTYESKEVPAVFSYQPKQKIKPETSVNPEGYKPFSLPSALPDPANTKDPILAHAYALGRGIEKGRDVVTDALLHPIDTVCSTAQTVGDGYNALADVVFGVSTEDARFRNVARGTAVVDTVETFAQAGSVKQTEMVAQFVSTGILGAAVGGLTTGSTVYSLEKAGLAIETKYGHVFQSAAPSALKASKAVKNGATLYRAGKQGLSEGIEGQFWALEEPGQSATYAQRYGVPPKNSKFDFIQSGQIMQGEKFITRPAVPFGPNPGGAIEVVVNPDTVLPHVRNTAPTIVPQVIGGRSILSQYSRFLTPSALSSESTVGATIAAVESTIKPQHKEGPK